MSLPTSPSHFLGRICLILILTTLFFAANVNAGAYQEDFKVGDVVEFDFLGKPYQAEIFDFTGTGWPKVKFEYRGKLTERFFPPSRLKLVESAQGKSAGQNMAPPAEMRKWTDTTGSFSVNAKLVSDENGNIKLEKEDGRVITLPLTKLSDEDQTYLEELKKQNSAANPFAGGDMSTPSKSTNNSQPSAPKSQPVIPAIEPNGTANEMVLSDQGWSVQPDAAAVTKTNGKVINFQTGFTRHEFHNRLSSVSLINNGQSAVAAITNPFEDATELLIADLVAAKSNSPMRINLKDATLLAVNSDGSQAVTYKKGRGRDPGEIAFWDLKDEAIQTAAWKTASFFDRDGLTPNMGKFVESNRLLTVGRRVILWDCESATAVYSYPTSESNKPALSANGKQLAVVSGKSVFIINVSDGNILGKIEPPTATKSLAFSPSGESLAGINSISGEIWIWDLTNNQLTRELSAPPSMVQSMTWVGEDYLLINNSSLIDIRLRATVWSYRSTGGSILNANDSRFWFIGKSKFTPISLPHKNLAAQTEKLNPEDLLVLTPDSEVSLDLKLPFTRQEQDQIRDRITRTLENNGVSIRNNAKLKLVLTVIKGKQEKAEMSSITDPFGRRGTESIKYTPQICSITLVKDGVDVWRTSRRFGPMGMIQLKRGESAQAAAKRLCKPSPSFFESVRIPKYIGQLPSGKPLGQSTISEQGVN
ncbi:SHD1 domain-containing protein [bacterium]|nr:SHD1 domain-containing protein [Mariniblastus sp.]MDB4385763.1 SHD1 domain-containing protein [bacterium]MDB4367939.1 SHD1 domain-containing protein [Mariniblastus sp.]MDB4391754.1 SHD1 domain-containing protein [bacterium]MDB4396343.1 SHD1 domain-containing protein [bacterium]